jgi:hypothetical protein
MSIGWILVIVLIIVLLGGVGGPWVGRPDYYGYGFGHNGVGIVGVILIVLVILLLTGYRF